MPFPSYSNFYLLQLPFFWYHILYPDTYVQLSNWPTACLADCKRSTTVSFYLWRIWSVSRKLTSFLKLRSVDDIASLGLQLILLIHIETVFRFPFFILSPFLDVWLLNDPLLGSKDLPEEKVSTPLIFAFVFVCFYFHHTGTWYRECDTTYLYKWLDPALHLINLKIQVLIRLLKSSNIGIG